MFGTESTEPNIFKYCVPITKLTRTGTGIEKNLLQLYKLYQHFVKIINILYISHFIDIYGILEPK